MKKYISITLLLLSFFGCTKQPKVQYLDPQLKAQFNFKQGSYWIYKDSISGKVDSFYLESVHITKDSTFLYVLSDKKICEKMTINIIQTSISIPYPQNPIWSLRILKPFGNKFKTSYKKDEIQIQTISANSYYIGNGIEKELKVLNNTFVDVQYVEEPNILFYLKEDIGYIKMRLNYDDGATKINEVWELQRWHIVK